MSEEIRDKDYERVISAVFTSEKNWDFSINETLTSLGYDTCITTTHESLRGSVLSLVGEEREMPYERARNIFSIQSNLNDMVEGNETEQKNWLNEPHKALNGKTPRELIVSGDPKRQELVAALFRSRD